MGRSARPGLLRRDVALSTVASACAIVSALLALEAARSHGLFDLGWGPPPSIESLVLRGLLLHGIHISANASLRLFEGLEVVTLPLRRRLLVTHAYLLVVGWGTLVLKFFGGYLAALGQVFTQPLIISTALVCGYLASLFVQIYGVVAMRLARERNLAAQFYRQSVTDQLTALPNRMLFRDRLQMALAQARRTGQSLAVLFIDLDRFKNINDTLGHSVGDQLLVEVAKRLGRCVRETDTVARMGGDEFLVLAPSLQPAREGALVLAERILEELSRPVDVAGHRLAVTASVGLALAPDDGEDVETLVKNADAAMYQAKAQGPGRASTYTRALEESGLSRLALEKDLREAVSRNQLVVHFQPQVDIHTRRLVGMEALVRWQHPERGLLQPERFIPLAEESGVIAQIDRWVLRDACERTQAWLQAGLGPLHVTCNVSAPQLQDPAFVDYVRRALAETGLDPKRLELEMTESAVMQDPAAAAATIVRLRAMGVRVSIDDFGTGYSSLHYLKRFSLDTLKLDRSFVTDIDTDPGAAAIASAIIAMAHSLKLKVIAEGVETDAQLKFLRGLGADEVQGHLTSSALDPEAFERLLRAERPRVALVG